MSILTAVKGSLPSSPVLSNLRHLNIRVEFLDFIRDCVFVLVTEVVYGLLEDQSYHIQ